MINIAICGANGKMGKTIYGCVCERRDCKVVGGIDMKVDKYADFPIVQSAAKLPVKPDVIIDYSNPEALEGLLVYCLSTGIPAVIATTGYSHEQLCKIKRAAEHIPIFSSFNMSLGINLLVHLAKKAAAVLGGQFDIEIIEKHHNTKIDAPSGTAIMLANAINDTFDNQMHYVYDRHTKRKARDRQEIGMHAIRGGTIVGDHDVIFAGIDEVITLSHSAASKSVFATGSINAALYIKNKPAGLYTMANLVDDLK